MSIKQETNNSDGLFCRIDLLLKLLWRTMWLSMATREREVNCDVLLASWRAKLRRVESGNNQVDIVESGIQVALWEAICWGRSQAGGIWQIMYALASGKNRDDDQIRCRSQPTNEPGPNCNERGFETWAGKTGTQVAQSHRRRETRVCEDYSWWSIPYAGHYNREGSSLVTFTR